MRVKTTKCEGCGANEATVFEEELSPWVKFEDAVGTCDICIAEAEAEGEANEVRHQFEAHLRAGYIDG
jgi:hypothetical protein